MADATVRLQTSVVLQLPHDLHKRSWLRARVLAAGDQLRQDCATCALSCFFWNEVDTPHSLSANELSDWTSICEGRLIDFAREVAPAHMALLRALRLPQMPAGWGPKKTRWQWFYADVPFILAAHQRPDLFGLTVSRVWYLEWDVGWTGSLGTVLVELNKTQARRKRIIRSSNGSLTREDDRVFGYGIKHMTCFDCRGSLWQGCRPGDWSTISRSQQLRKRRTICAGLTPIVWYRYAAGLDSRLSDSYPFESNDRCLAPVRQPTAAAGAVWSASGRGAALLRSLCCDAVHRFALVPRRSVLGRCQAPKAIRPLLLPGLSTRQSHHAQQLGVKALPSSQNSYLPRSGASASIWAALSTPLECVEPTALFMAAGAVHAHESENDLAAKKHS